MGRTMPADAAVTLIREFLAQGPYAVVGVSTNRDKYGNKVLRAYLQNDLDVFPVHPKEAAIEGVPCVPTLAELPEPVRGLSMITPPPVTERLVEEAHAARIPMLWMQPGAESEAAVRRAEELGMKVIAGGPCLLVALHFREE
jgi:predicted CoA-binding protein